MVESGTLSAGETRDYTFTARAGTQVDFDGKGTHWQVRSGLLDPEGNNIVDNINSCLDFGYGFNLHRERTCGRQHADNFEIAPFSSKTKKF